MHLSGRASQAATCLLEQQQTGTVHVEPAASLESHLSAQILHDQLSVTSYALKLSFRERQRCLEIFLTPLPVGETGQDFRKIKLQTFRGLMLLSYTKK